METRVSRIKIPTTGVFDFPKLIQEGKGKYVDKTALLYELCNDADAQLLRGHQLRSRETRHRRPARRGDVLIFRK